MMRTTENTYKDTTFKDRAIFVWQLLIYGLSWIPIILLTMIWGALWLVVATIEAYIGHIVYALIWFFTGKWLKWPVLRAWEKIYGGIEMLGDLMGI